jgi:hypothetical protein
MLTYIDFCYWRKSRLFEGGSIVLKKATKLWNDASMILVDAGRHLRLE